MLKGNIKLTEKIAKKQNPNRGRGGSVPKAGTGDNRESNKKKASRLALCQSECIVPKKVPTTPGGTSTKKFTKK